MVDLYGIALALLDDFRCNCFLVCRDVIWVGKLIEEISFVLLSIFYRKLDFSNIVSNFNLMNNATEPFDQLNLFR
jgi:hypothetical protein